MNRILIAAALVMLITGSAFGQTPADKPAATPAPEMKEEPKPAPQKEIAIVQGPGQAKVKEDARHCLEQSTNADIIRCAEPYLPLRLLKKM